VLTRAADTLEEIRQKRQRRDEAVNDPLVAHIIRCQAINSSRDFTTYAEGAFHTRPAEPEKAASLLGLLEAPAARQFFDPATVSGNRELLEHVKAETH
jgi:hypothetical protein